MHLIQLFALEMEFVFLQINVSVLLIILEINAVTSFQLHNVLERIHQIQPFVQEEEPVVLPITAHVSQDSQEFNAI
jgi:hypothetical protein